MILFIIILIFILFCILFNNKIENFSCPRITCCRAGYYYVNKSCVICPKERPFSPTSANGAPDHDCICPNDAVSSCRACDKCSTYDSKNGICTPMKCGSGMKCNKGKCVVINR